MSRNVSPLLARPNAAMELSVGDDAALAALGFENDLAPGTVVDDRWLLLRELGRGSQCLALEMVDLAAVDTLGPDPARLPRAVLKALRPALAEDVAARATLAHEAAILKGVDDVPGVVRFLGDCAPHGRPALRLSLAPGRSLARVLAESHRHAPVPRPLWRGLLTNLAETLILLHQRGVVHGDLKPGNVVVGAEGRTTLIDFGGAHLTTRPTSPVRPAAAVAVTPTWASPSQALGCPPTEADDVYALALLAARIISGSHPFDGSSPSVAQQQGRAAHPVRQAPRALRLIIEQVLNAPGGRHEVSAAAMGDAVRRSGS